MTLTDVFPTFHVYIAFPTDPSSRIARFDISTFDGDVFADDDEDFIEVTDRLDSTLTEPIHLRGGRESPLSDYDTRFAQIVLRNDDGRFDPLNLDGPYVSGGESFVKLGRRMQVTAELADGSVESRFYGQVDRMIPGVNEPGWPTMTIEAKGLFAVLARSDPLASAPTGAGETAGDRYDRLCDIPGIPDSDRNFSTGLRALQATTTALPTLTECRLVAATESPLGGFYEARDGRLNGDQATDVLTASRSATPRVTLGPPGVADTLPYVELVPAFDKKQLENDVSIAAVGGNSRTGEDASSISSYLRYPGKRTDLLFANDEDVERRVIDELYFFAEPRYRYDSVTISCNAGSDAVASDLIDFMATSELRDRVAVLEQIDYPGDPLADDYDPVTSPFTRETTEEVLIEHIDEWIGESSWRQTLTLSSARAISNVAYFDVSDFDGSDVFAPF